MLQQKSRADVDLGVIGGKRTLQPRARACSGEQRVKTELAEDATLRERDFLAAE